MINNWVKTPFPITNLDFPDFFCVKYSIKTGDRVSDNIIYAI
jgi:hypothetical protein